MPTINFKGKATVETLHLTIPYRQLMPNPAASNAEKPSLDDNIVIHGDNLLALKTLLPTFGGKVKCISIDPPYNTGNEGWIYNDNVNSPIHQEWLKKVVDREDLTRHDKWLCMMLPRLRLLKDLLREDGVIFVSIDEPRSYLGESRQYEVYMIYRPNVQFLKTTPLTLAWAQALGEAGDKPRLVIAPYKLLDNDLLREMKIEYCQFPFGIYRFRV